MNSQIVIQHRGALQGDTESGSVLQPPYSAYSTHALLSHYQIRSNVNYFPVADPQETRRDRIDAILENRFEFNGETHLLPEPVCWMSNPSTDIEWHILLHKFYYAVGLGMAYQDTQDPRYLNKWIALTSSWIEQTPPGFIASDVTGRRVQNWIYAHYYFVTQNPSAAVPADFHDRFLASLHEQVNYLCTHLAPARNHRTLELYSIFLAAVVFPEMRDASGWLAFALQEIVDNVMTDLLPDGVQIELSTDYHHIVLKNYLCVRRLAKLNGIDVPSKMDQLLIKALEFSLHVHKPDGIVPSLSDGDARSYLDLLEQGHELYSREDMLWVATKGARGKPPAVRSKGFPDSGYYILRSGWGMQGERYQDERYLVFDCGPLGAGNHGHLDLLSFELAAYGKSLVVDPGRYTYDEAGETNWRVRFRGTAYHNTVQVDGRDQTRYLPGKTRYKIQGLPPASEVRAFVSESGLDFVHGIAKSQEYDVVHERRIFFIGGQYWVISDLLHATEAHQYDVLFHLSEHALGKTQVHRNADTCVVQTPGLVLAHADTAVNIDEGFVSYRYGEKLAAPIVRVTRRAKNAAFHSVLFPYRSDPPVITLRRIPVTDSQRTPADHTAQAFTITIEQAGERFTDTCFFAPDSQRGHWRFGNYRYNGSFLHLREDAHGTLTRLHSSDGAVLEESGRRLGSEDLTA